MSESENLPQIYGEQDGVVLFGNERGVFITPPTASPDIVEALVTGAFDPYDNSEEPLITPEHIVPGSVLISSLISRARMPDGTIVEARGVIWMTEGDVDDIE